MFRRAELRLASFLLLIAAALGAGTAAHAQFRGGYAFLQAVESRDGTKATEALKDDSTLVNTRHPDSRIGQMPAFGRDGILEREHVSNVASYVYSLSNPEY